MLMDLAQPLKEGEKVPLTLTFADKSGQEDHPGRHGHRASARGGPSEALNRRPGMCVRI